ncbi:putative bifunctional diguanylate cyclase/phosphodiesterase [Allosphingosinicella indica]|uniref:putative bifunctional diguanylate cyclase/phosphodiesterase n=1 Tax=Allosphingosinicella indica TaxID=941907 RepID=UPI001FCD8D2A|nr:EAL domain-containing protein [Allosphingosinicella indica]
MIIGVAVGILLLLAAIGNFGVESAAALLTRFGADNSTLVLCLLLVNVALTLYGIRRYRDTVTLIRDREAAERRARSLASTDPLTGLYNRRAFAACIAELLGNGPKVRSVALIVIDIDGFKSVNELHGHLTGDLLLRHAADLIQAATPGDAVVARLGADEFGVAFRFDPDRPDAVDSVAATIVAHLGTAVDLGGVHVHVSASAGIACTDQECDRSDPLLRRADIAMCAAKKEGRGERAWFDATLERELRNRNETEAGLRRGVPAGEFVPFFEQQIDLESGALHGFEMLARWNHPERGLVPPDEFIDVAEESGLISDLSLSVFRQGLEIARHWDPALTLSVNISPTQLKDPWLAQKLVKLLVETNFPPERLEVEITESSLFENLGLAQSIIASLKNQGIRIALDDFGTGYSSLGHLRALPFDRIKIDRSFVQSLTDNSESRAIVSAIARLAESLGLAVTAEGIEDTQILERLRAIGHFKGQGWLFGRPMPAAEVEPMLAARNLLAAAPVAVAAPSQTVRRAG